MQTMMGLINLGQEQDFFNELTYFRNGASIPFAGRYRLIDFPLSNMRNSDIEEIAIFTPGKYRSLMDHIKSGGDWGMGRRSGGLFILPPDWHDPSDISKGDLRFFHNHRDYFERGTSEHVLISGSQFITNTNYQNAFQAHLETGADVTLITTNVNAPQPEHHACFRIESNENGEVTAITNEWDHPQLFTGVYIIKKQRLMALVDQCMAHHKDHFFVHSIKENLANLHINVYENEGYGMFVNSIESYYRQTMQLLSSKNYQELFYKKPFIRTKIGSQPPTKYRWNARVSNSIVANGCNLNGGVEESVLFRGVSVAEGASIKNSIIMQRCTIESGVYLENVILDKDVHITSNQQLIGSKENPYVIAKRKVI